VRRPRRPTVCPLCGIGGSYFVPSGTLSDDEGLSGGFREAWLDYGLYRADHPLLGGPGSDARVAA
jgi:hypothetical protein